MSKPKSSVSRTVLKAITTWLYWDAVAGVSLWLLLFLAIFGYVFYRGWLTYHR